MTDASVDWAKVRALFEQVCELPGERWGEELERLSGDPVLVRETLALLGAQTAELGGMAGHIDQMLARAARPELQIGDMVDHWRLVRHIASGGMGSVFVAERADGLYTHEVAIKLLRGLPDPYVSRQLASERQILASLNHPNIARLYDGGTTPMGQPYLVMEYVQGNTLYDHVGMRGAGLVERLRLFGKICHAVQAAHARMVLHCDLKSSNVLVRADGEPVLLDFGIAHLLGASEGQTRERFCTLPYASPELLQGEGVGVASDVFSLGVMLLELVSQASVHRTVQQAHDPLPRASVLATGRCAWATQLRGDLDAIIARACAIDPSRRYGSVLELAQELERHLGHLPVLARGAGRRYVWGRLLRRRWREAVVVGVSVLVVGGFMLGLRSARNEARDEAMMAQRVSAFLINAFDAADPKKRGAQAGTEVSAREILDSGASRIDQDLAQTPAMRARLRAVLGSAYAHLGLLPKAEPLLKQAAAELQAPDVDLPGEASSALHDLSLMLSNNTRSKEAIPLARQSLALAERSGDSGMVSGALNVLGVALQGQDQFAEAEQVLQRALVMRREEMRQQAAHGQEQSDDSQILGNLGLVRRNQGDYVAAERYTRQALAIKARRYGRGSVEYRDTLYNLAVAVLREGKIREGVSLLEENLRLTQSLFSTGSGALVDAHQELASAYQDAGDLLRARAQYALAEQATEAAGTAGSLDHAVLLNNFATLEESRGDLAAAEALYRRSWDIRKAALGNDARLSLNAEGNLGRLLMREGKMDQALPLLDHVYAGMAALLEPDDPRMLLQRLTRAEIWMRRGDFSRARQALADATPAGGWKASQLKQRRDELEAELDQRAGDHAAAREILSGLVTASQEEMDGTSLKLAERRLSLAESLVALDDLDDARRQLALAAPPLQAQLMPEAAPLKRLHAVQLALR